MGNPKTTSAGPVDAAAGQLEPAAVARAPSAAEARPPSTPAFPANVTEKLNEAMSRVQNWSAARLLWERLLSPEERRSLGGDVEAACRKYRGPVGLWRELRAAWQPRAII